MALSGKNSQARRTRRRDAVSPDASRHNTKSAIPAVFSAVHVASVPRLSAASHGKTTFGAQLGSLRHHASGNFLHVRNEIRTQPHRIGRAGLTRVGGALCAGAVKTAKQDCGRQGQPGNDTNGLHTAASSVARGFRPRPTVAIREVAVDGYRRIRGRRSVSATPIKISGGRHPGVVAGDAAWTAFDATS
jgi:hypothetical protein